VAPYTPAVEEDACRKVHYFSAAAQTAANMGLTTADTLELPYTTDAAFPMWLSSGDRVPAYQHSQFRVSDAYLKSDPEPRVDIHPDTAAGLAIQNGDRVRVTTRYGEVTVKARLTDEVRGDCLRMRHGWEEANVNELTGLAHLDPLSGFPWCRALPVRVVKREG
jgi:anaerobic selenocysteine-containing dehydrogenase